MRYVGIDPSTRTGLVILDEDGEVITQKEITGIGKVDPKRMGTLIQDLVKHVKKDDVIAIEGFSYGSQGQGTSFQYGLGNSIRIALWARKYDYLDIAPSQLKKFATGKGNAAKAAMIKPIKDNWGFSSSSDNITDAFVLAKIAYAVRNSDQAHNLLDYQAAVVDAVLTPTPKKAKPKKPKSKKKASA
jgi:crossover junction endodeoxyribonuclease RuvC